MRDKVGSMNEAGELDRVILIGFRSSSDVRSVRISFCERAMCSVEPELAGGVPRRERDSENSVM